MKKALSLLLAGVMCVGLLAGCGGQNTEDTQGSGSTPDTSSTQETGNKTIDTLRIAFVPSREPEEIITATEPLKQMLTDELAKLGYDVGEVDITVGTSYEAVLRQTLERCATYFTLVDGQPQIAEEFLLPKVEHYNYDFYAGLSYTFDLRRPVGSRVIRLTKLDGSPLGGGTFRLCTSNYRATGTGGYEILRECPVLWRGGVEMPDLTARYIQTHSPVPQLHNAEMRVIW